MNSFIILSCLVAVSLAMGVPRSPLEAAAARHVHPALQHEEIHDGFGQYALRYVTTEGTVVSEPGRLVRSPSGKGETSYIGIEGKNYVTK